MANLNFVASIRTKAPSSNEESKEEGKLDQSVVLYMDAKTLGSRVGAHCGDCWKYVGSEKGKGACVEVEGDIDPAHGVSCLYVNGRVFDGKKPDFEIVKVSKSVAGYFEKGPTHCETCEYFVKRGVCKKVKNSPQTIEEGGCCNKYEPEEEDEK